VMLLSAGSAPDSIAKMNWAGIECSAGLCSAALFEEGRINACTALDERLA